MQRYFILSFVFPVTSGAAFLKEHTLPPAADMPPPPGARQ
jgi:hypothetical protein